jgi:hypothetical protein
VLHPKEDTLFSNPEVRTFVKVEVGVTGGGHTHSGITIILRLETTAGTVLVTTYFSVPRDTLCVH